MLDDDVEKWKQSSDDGWKKAEEWKGLYYKKDAEYKAMVELKDQHEASEKRLFIVIEGLANYIVVLKEELRNKCR